MANDKSDGQSAGSLSKEDWDLLIKRIRDGECTPFLGAGVNGDLLPLGATIASQWAKKYKFPLREKFDLARVSQYLALTGPEKIFPKTLMRDLIENKMKERFSDGTPPDFTPPNHPLGVLAALPLPIYITTNYDDFMYRALMDNRKYPKVELCAWNSLLPKRAAVKYPKLSDYNPPVVPPQGFSFEKSILTKTYAPVRNTAEPTVYREPLVYHLHGHYSLVDSMVLTENDYLDFLVNMWKDQKLLPSQISLALTDCSLLFMGYSLADPNFRVLFRGLIHSMGENRRLSISIQLRPGDLPRLNGELDSDGRVEDDELDGNQASDEKRELTDEEKQDLIKRKERALEFLKKYFDDMKIKVFWGSAEEFAVELWRRWNGGI